MRKSFSAVPRPMLAGVVKENRPEAAIGAIRNCEFAGATGIDLHLSCLNKAHQTAEEIKRIVDAARLPILVLNYNLAYGGGGYETDEEERVALLLKGIEAGAAAADIQGYTFDLYSKTRFRSEYAHLPYSFIKGAPREVVVDDAVIGKQTALIEQIHSMGAEVLLSNHVGIPMTADQLVELALFLEKRNPDIIKLVAPAETEEELLEAFKAMCALRKEVKTPVSYHCVGKMGALTRIVNPLLGSFMCFCNERFTASSDFNQPRLETMKTIFDNINRVIQA